MKTRNRAVLGIDCLESRNAPATLVNSTTVTYVDGDDDVVTVKTTKGTFDLAADFVFLPLGSGRDLLQRVELANKFEFHGASITVTSTPSAGGDGFVNVGFINADQIDLVRATVDGDLGRIVAGDSTVKTTGLGTLKARSLGSLGVTTQQPGGTLLSVVTGRLGKLDVTTNIVGAEVNATGGQYGTVGSIVVGGSMIGNATPDSASVFATGSIGAVTIGDDLTGGPAGGTNSGRIDSHGNIASIHIGGSMIGGGATGAGTIQADGNLGPVFVGDGVTGGTGIDSGLIRTNLGGNIASVTIVGALAGGGGTNSGKIQISSGGNLGPVKIGTAAAPTGLFGGAGTGSGSIEVINNGNIASVTVSGSVTGSTGNNSGTIRIADAGNIGPVKISGDLAGGGGPSSGSIQVIDNGSIASVTITGAILGSSGLESGSIQTDRIGNIGPVKIGTNINGGIGNASGLIRTADGSIASITTGGSISGSNGSPSGAIIAAQDLGPVVVGGAGSLVGGIGTESGAIISRNGDMASVTLNGSLIGASGNVTNSGTIQAERGALPKVAIANNVQGGNIAGTESSTNTGYIAGQNIGSVTIGGSLIAGIDGGATLINSGAIRAGHQLKSVSLGGAVGNASNNAVISGRGQVNPTATTDLAIGNVTIRVDASFLRILAGYNQLGAPVNPDAQIGSVNVGSKWQFGDIVAGAVAGNSFFGDTLDASIVGVDTSVVSRIGSIVIAGTITGTNGGADSFGFVAEHVVSVRINGVQIGMTAGARNDLFPGNSAGALTGDVTILEVA